MSDVTPGQAACETWQTRRLGVDRTGTWEALSGKARADWEAAARAAIGWWHRERDLEPPRTITATGTPPGQVAFEVCDRATREALRVVVSERDEAREQHSACRDKVSADETAVALYEANEGLAAEVVRLRADLADAETTAKQWPKCPDGCGCRLNTEDADARECGCDGPCTMECRENGYPDAMSYRDLAVKDEADRLRGVIDLKNRELTELATASIAAGRDRDAAISEQDRIAAKLRQQLADDNLTHAEYRQTALEQLNAARSESKRLKAENEGLARGGRALERVVNSHARAMYAAHIETVHGDPEDASTILNEQLDGYDGPQWDGTESGIEWLERTRGMDESAPEPQA